MTSAAPALAQILRDQPLAPRLTLETGGNAQFFVEARSEAEVAASLQWAHASKLPVLVLGGGSNLVLADSGFDGLVIQLRSSGIRTLTSDSTGTPDSADSVLLEVAAGHVWDDFVEHCVAQGWSGVECLSGIPGRVGATPIQNVGAYGQEVSQTIDSVRCIDRASLEPIEFSNPECGFGYRHSRFKSSDRERYVVTTVRFRLSLGPPAQPKYPDLAKRLPEHDASLRQIREAVIFTRRQKSMVWDPDDPNHRSCGSFFVNPVLSAQEFAELQTRCPTPPPHYPQADAQVKVPAAWLIEQAGFEKGLRSGRVGLSTQHTLCLVAHEGATTAEVVQFARRVRQGVLERFGVELQAEPVFVGVSLLANS